MTGTNHGGDYRCRLHGRLVVNDSCPECAILKLEKREPGTDERDAVEGIWTDREHGLAFCWPCLDGMGGLAPGVTYIVECIRQGEIVNCENCGVALERDGYDERIGR